MTSAACRREWEAEAARDGRLPTAARLAHEAHARQCAHCSRERAQLEQLALSLRAVSPHIQDELVLARARRRVLESVNGELLGVAPSGRRRARWAFALTSLAAALAAFGLLARQGAKPVVSGAPAAAWMAASGLRLVASSGARFDRERRPGLDYVALHEGTLSVDFTRGPHADLLVRVPDGEIRDLGTVFRVVVSASHTSEISVSEGAVVFRRPDAADVILLAGESFQRAADSDAAGSGTVASSEPAVRNGAARAKRTARLPATPLAARAPDSPRAAPAAASPEDAAYLRMVGYLQAGHVQPARVAARAYLRAFPNGFRRSEVERVAAARD